MATGFEFIVIGRGMTAAVARRLTLEGKRVAPIDPEEPADRLAYQVFLPAITTKPGSSNASPRR